VLEAVLLSCALQVIDGDTLKCDDERIRIENIDAPETTYRAHCEYEITLGKAAAWEAMELISKAKEARIVRNARKDYYGRTLAFIELDGRDLGESLIKAGYAQPWAGRKAEWCD
jgi:endonuclease YncB( thermonuclease family)